jgi:hypothetical protein
MKFRALALGAAVSAAASGLIPATAMAASAATAARPSGPPSTSTSTRLNTSASASASNRTNVNVEVVAQLPRDIYWHDKTLYRDGRELALPSGYSYRDGGVVGPQDRFYFAPAGQREGVIVAPMKCQGGYYNSTPVKSGNWIGNIVDGALKACATVYDTAYNIIESAVGNSDVYGGRC